MMAWSDVTQIVLGYAEAAPMAFLKALMVHLEHVDGAATALAGALEDMAHMFLEEADTLEAEGRALGQNVVPMEGKA